MNGSAKLWAASTSILMAITLAVTYMAYPSVASPTTEEIVLPNGLITRIRFSAPSYRAFDTIVASYEYYNPTSVPVTFTPTSFLRAEAGYEGGYHQGGGVGGMPQPPSVTLAPGETYINANKYPRIAPVAGRFNVELNDTRGSVKVLPGRLGVRIETTREEFKVGVGGTASLVVYNQGTSEASYGYEVFSQLEFRHGYVSDADVVWDSEGIVVFRDYFSSGKVILAPGETRIEERFYFGTPRAGTIVLDINGVQKSVTVIL